MALRPVLLGALLLALVPATAEAGPCHRYSALLDGYLVAARDAAGASAGEIERQRVGLQRERAPRVSRGYCNALSAAMARGEELLRYVEVNGPACGLPPLPPDTVAGIAHTGQLWKTSCAPRVEPVVLAPSPAPPVGVPVPPAIIPGPPTAYAPAPAVGPTVFVRPLDVCLIESELEAKREAIELRVASVRRGEYENWSLTARDNTTHLVSRRYCDTLAERISVGEGLVALRSQTVGRCERAVDDVAVEAGTAGAAAAFDRYCRRREAFRPG